MSSKDINQVTKPTFVFIGEKCIGELIEETEDSLVIKYQSMYKAIHKDEENLNEQ